MVKNIEVAKKKLLGWYPRLEHDGFFNPTSEETDEYNCIAWAMRLPDRRVEPVEGANSWWPLHGQREEDAMSQDSLIMAFNKVGFVVCEDNHNETFFDKVALYCQPDDRENDDGWTHAARILNANEYHSKAGESYDFHHGNGVRLLYNPYRPLYSYGHIYAYMKRPKYKRLCSYWLRFIKLVKDFCDECLDLFEQLKIKYKRIQDSYRFY